MKGISFTAFYFVFHDSDNDLIKKFNIFVGSSIGAFFNLLMLLNYTPSNTISIFFFTRFEEYYKDINIVSLMNGKHLCEAKWLRKYIKDCIKHKNLDYKTLTFQKFYELTKKTFIVTGVLEKNFHTVLFSHYTSPNELIWKAIYGSMSVPILVKSLTFDLSNYSLKDFPFDKQYLYDGQALYGDNPKCIIIDGGTVDNFPVIYFDLSKTLGVRLSERIAISHKEVVYNPKTLSEQANTIFSSFTRLLSGLIDQIELRHLYQKAIYEIVFDNEFSTFSTSLTMKEKTLAFFNAVKKTKEFILNPFSHVVYK